MADVRLSGIVKTFGDVKVIHGIDLEIRHREAVVFVGPSGCGKSTLLRMIAGLEDITDGELYIDGLLCNDVAPRDRGIAMVFQSYALYPHMTVYENVGFALRFAKLSRAERDAKIREAARILQMEALLDRKPAQLSGGQRQRVAIGRAIVRHPKVFLFDEPLSNLDAALRVDMRMEIARLHQTLDTTMIYVTHDQVEAMTLADKIVVLDKGVVQQVGAPLDLYNTPANLFVAGFIGSPKMNLLPVQRTGGNGGAVEVRSAALKPLGFAAAGAADLPGDLVVGIRPQAIRLTAPDGALMPARARLVERLGDETVISAELASGEAALVVVPGDATVRPGEAIGLTFDAADAHLFLTSGPRIETRRAPAPAAATPA
jgi:multiple sugar transport system ATP-binding protein